MKILHRICFIYFYLFIFLPGCCNDLKTTTSNKSEDNPEITFDVDFYDFKNVYEGEKVKHTFLFENTGGGELKVNSVIPDCGCIILDWTKRPLNYGEKGKINVIFDSTGKSGIQYKSFNIRTNENKKSKTIYIKANVINNF